MFPVCKLLSLKTPLFRAESMKNVLCTFLVKSHYIECWMHSPFVILGLSRASPCFPSVSAPFVEVLPELLS